MLTLPRGRRARARGTGQRGHVVDYRHIIHALRRKPMALLNLVYRDQLFPRDRLPARLGAADRDRASQSRPARPWLALLLAHERGCEAELAAALERLPRRRRAARPRRAGRAVRARDRRGRRRSSSPCRRWKPTTPCYAA